MYALCMPHRGPQFLLTALSPASLCIPLTLVLYAISLLLHSSQMNNRSPKSWGFPGRPFPTWKPKAKSGRRWLVPQGNSLTQELSEAQGLTLRS